MATNVRIKKAHSVAATCPFPSVVAAQSMACFKPRPTLIYTLAELVRFIQIYPETSLACFATSQTLTHPCGQSSAKNWLSWLTVCLRRLGPSANAPCVKARIVGSRDAVAQVAGSWPMPRQEARWRDHLRDDVTRPAFIAFPRRSLSDVVTDILPEETYDFHNAEEDSRAVLDLLEYLRGWYARTATCLSYVQPSEKEWRPFANLRKRISLPCGTTNPVTGIAMSHAPAIDWRASPERLDESLGYIAGNCVLIISELNTSAQWSHPKITHMVKALLSVVNGATAHDENVQQLPKSALHRFLRTLLKDAKWNISKKAAFRNLTCDLTVDELTDIFVAQNGRCFYSGMPLNIGMGSHLSWAGSVERLDVFRGYTKSNCALICREFQACDRSSIIVYSNGGGTFWTPEKLRHFFTMAVLWSHEK
ncbi:hypothetical protein DFS34DRAFT_653276 [Phlyctochytrium arcticum]|nr:hypothetical protein DFS34DRAFT_653276 [Phlyctochytrium arcticum]